MIFPKKRSPENTYPEIEIGYQKSEGDYFVAGVYTYKRFKYRGKWYTQLFCNEFRTYNAPDALIQVMRDITKAVHINDLFHMFDMKLFRMIPSYELDEDQRDEKERVEERYLVVRK